MSSKISDLAALGSGLVATGDLFCVVDISDTSMAASGTDKKVTFASLMASTSDSTIATSLLTAIKTVDGAGSGLDADLLDGISSGGFALASHTHAASDIASGTIATARLGSGTANNTTYLRGDQTYATPTGGSVGGSDTQVLFNDGGTESGDPDLTWNKTTNSLSIAGGKGALTENGSGAILYLNSNHGQNYLDGSGEMFMQVYTRFACYDVFGRYIFVANSDGTYLRCDTSAPSNFYSNSLCAAWIDETNNILNFKVKRSDAAFVTFAVQPNGPVVLKDFIADVGNSGTSETDLFSYTTAANRLNANGEKIVAEYSGNLAGAVTTTPELKIKFAGTTIFDINSLAAGTNGDFELWVTLIRVSATVVRYNIAAQVNGITTQLVKSNELTGLTLSATNILKLTGQSTGTGAATNDIVAKMGHVEWKPAGA